MNFNWPEAVLRLRKTSRKKSARYFHLKRGKTKKKRGKKANAGRMNQVQLGLMVDMSALYFLVAITSISATEVGLCD